ncbi:MAG: hypothetical protein WCL44_09870 [bacterium]
MARPWRIRFAGAKYHVTSRGNGREAVLWNRKDEERFLEQLDEALKEDQVVLALDGEKQRDVARYFGYRSESAAGKQRRLVQAQLAEDKKLASGVATIESVVRKGISK